MNLSDWEVGRAFWMVDMEGKPGRLSGRLLKIETALKRKTPKQCIYQYLLKDRQLFHCGTL